MTDYLEELTEIVVDQTANITKSMSIEDATDYVSRIVIALVLAMDDAGARGNLRAADICRSIVADLPA